MSPHSESERDRALLRECRDGNPAALRELSYRYYTDVYLQLSEVLSPLGYQRAMLEDMTLDCLGKVCEEADLVARWRDLDTIVARAAAFYARVERRNVLRRNDR